MPSSCTSRGRGSGRGYPEIEKILYICHRYHTTLDALFADELPPVEAEEAEVEQPIAGKPLKRSFVDFLSNLSPYDKLIGGTLSVDDLRVYLTTESQAVLNRSTGAKTAERVPMTTLALP